MEEKDVCFSQLNRDLWEYYAPLFRAEGKDPEKEFTDLEITREHFIEIMIKDSGIEYEPEPKKERKKSGRLP